MIIASASHFHVYLPCLSPCLAQCLKCKSSSRRFQAGEGPSSGLLRDCENQWIVSSSINERELAMAEIVVLESGHLLDMLQLPQP